MNQKIWTTDLIGVLAEDDFESLSFRQNIFINSQDVLQCLLKLISQPPESFPNVKYITCFATDLEKWGFEDDPYTTDEIRKQNLRDFLNDNLIVFNAERKVLYNHNEVYQAKNVRLIPKAESYRNNVSLFPIPVFSESAHKLSFEEFCFKLQNRKFVGRIDNISNEINDTPSYVMWQHEDGSYSLLGEFDKHQYAHGGFSFSVRGELKHIEFEEEWLEDSYTDSESIPNVMFVTLERYQQITEEMEQAKTVDHILQQRAGRNNVVIEQAAAAIEEVVEFREEIQSAPVTSTSETMNEPPFILGAEENSNEMKFLELFVATTQEMGLIYAEKDLYNFHTAMKSSNLVILAGMSGTGKSKLVSAYSRALGLYSDQFTYVPVRPSWSDDADLIGYADTLHMVYRPGDSGLINVLMQAQKEEDKLFIICFDEMNLARVEHYFSQFLSILEMEPGKRELRLYNDELANRLYNSAQYPPTISIKDNVLFVGTVNLDESTYHFSDKVLDRANVIQLQVMEFNHLREITDKKKIVHSRDQAIDFVMYDSFKNKNRTIELSDRELQFLWELHEELRKVSKQLGIGPRIVRQIDAYLKNLPAHPTFTRQEAFDMQIIQRILTKIRGSEEQLYPLLGKYVKAEDQVHDSLFMSLLEKYRDVSPFTATKEEIIKKARELKFNGYTV